MFNQTFVDGAQKTKEPVAFALSILLESCGIGLLILIPLIYTQALPNAQLRSLLMAPTAPSAPPKPPTQPKVSTRPVAVRRLPVFVAPAVIPKQINTNVQEIQAAPDILIPGLQSATGPASDTILGAGQLYSIQQTPPPPPPVDKSKPRTTLVRIATGVAEANLIRKVMPIYPPLAKSARVQGTVEFTAIISKEGNIENLRLVRGHPLLVKAAEEAVLQWRYRPTLLNGQPVEVVTDIIVNFTLSQ
jgi:protein TonB